MIDKKVNSELYWDFRFANNWENCDGPSQSRFFAELALKNLPPWLLEQSKHRLFTWADWGCAQGDGTRVFEGYVNAGSLVGVDFSEVAIQQAQARHPNVRFICANWLDSDTRIDETYDVVFSSNTLEHFHNPYEVLTTLAARAKKAVVLALPYREVERIHEHFFSFFPESIPRSLQNGFQLIWSRVLDCRGIAETAWSGDQIVLVYANHKWTDSLALTLSDLEVSNEDHISVVNRFENTQRSNQARLDELNVSLTYSKELVSTLEYELAEQAEKTKGLHLLAREESLKNENLMLSVDAKEKEIQSARTYIQDKEMYIAMLRLELNKFQSRIDTRVLRRLSQVKRIPQYIGRAIQIKRTAGWRELSKVISLKLTGGSRGIENSYIEPGALKRPQLVEQSFDANSRIDRPLFSEALVIITGVPFDDVGGGQRAAQLARCALKAGRKVVYLYLYKKFDFEQNKHVESEVNLLGLFHLHISRTTPLETLSRISSDSTLLIEIPHKDALPYLKLCNTRRIRTVFELIDDWESSLGGDWFSLDVYRQFVAEAQIPVGTARVLVRKLQDLGRSDTLYLPNAANEYIFDKYKKFARPADMPGRNKRTALYFGSLYGEWFAWDYLIRAAHDNPNMAFVLIGDKPNKSDLPRNIYLLGGRRIDELPAYIAHASLSILPFVPGKISDAVSPIKVFEYLFAGTPVVSTALPEVRDYPGVYFARDSEEFSRMCRDAVLSENQVRENDRFIFQNSWFSRLQCILGPSTPNKFSKLVSVIILIHNNKNIIGRCLESLYLHCADYIKEVIVVDNASSDGGSAFVEENFPAAKIVHNPINGCSSGRNLGISHATGRYLAFFDSDQWFTSSMGFAEALAILERDANVGAIGWAAGWFDEGRDDLGGMITDYCPNRAMNDLAISRGYRSDIGYLGTGGFFTPKSVIDATQGFDTAYDPTCFEDTDLSFQIKKLGFDICYRDLTGFRHQPHQTTQASSGSEVYDALFRRNAKYFKEKWASQPNFFSSYKD